ncbi:MAG TPA: glutamine synthetase, partial [Parvularcula sp.]|nr:glutamine synthetase [Parvularcula sp.]
SLIGVDIWGNDVFDNGLVVDTGDSDGLCPIVRPGLKPCPWSATPTLQAQVMMA